MLTNRTIGVVIPAYNEERLLPRTIARLPAFVDVIVVVDDASEDRTTIAARCDPRVVVCRHSENRGVGAAIVTGYLTCLDRGVDVAVVVGADDQMHPDDMPTLLLPILRGEADYVCGDRLMWPGGWRAFPALRLFGVVTLAILTRAVTGIDTVKDAQCGYTAISRQALQRIPLERLFPRYGFPNDMLAKASMATLRVVSRPIRPIYADEVSSMKIHRVCAPILHMLATNWLERIGPRRYLERPEELDAADSLPARLSERASME